MHWRTTVTGSGLFSHPDSASVEAVSVPSSLLGKELIDMLLRQDIVNFLVNCVLLVELIEGKKWLMCVEVCIILAVALSMQHSHCSL